MRTARDVVRCCIPWSAMARGSMSPWERCAMIPPSAQPHTFLSAPKRHGSISPTACRNIKGMSPRADGPVSHQKQALAVDLLFEQFIGFLRLVDAPAMGEQFVDIDAALDREPCAFRLQDVGERPGRHQRQL